mmetsp:Transcript_14242/g.36223  ORF Transcript_14242/g.36223 Transcript_14242/m.36223 type:complete len:479 (-) Transcript_14242:196-1632(-)
MASGDEGEPVPFPPPLAELHGQRRAADERARAHLLEALHARRAGGLPTRFGLEAFLDRGVGLFFVVCELRVLHGLGPPGGLGRRERLGGRLGGAGCAERRARAGRQALERARLQRVLPHVPVLFCVGGEVRHVVLNVEVERRVRRVVDVAVHRVVIRAPLDARRVDQGGHLGPAHPVAREGKGDVAARVGVGVAFPVGQSGAQRKQADQHPRVRRVHADRTVVDIGHVWLEDIEANPRDGAERAEGTLGAVALAHRMSEGAAAIVPRVRADEQVPAIAEEDERDLPVEEAPRLVAHVHAGALKVDVVGEHGFPPLVGREPSAAKDGVDGRHRGQSDHMRGDKPARAIAVLADPEASHEPASAVAADGDKPGAGHVVHVQVGADPGVSDDEREKFGLRGHDGHHPEEIGARARDAPEEEHVGEWVLALRHVAERSRAGQGKVPDVGDRHRPAEAEDLLALAAHQVLVDRAHERRVGTAR